MHDNKSSIIYLHENIILKSMIEHFIHFNDKIEYILSKFH